MVDLTRRKTVIGLGLLATGSGATFTSAAFQSSTQPASDLRVVVDQNLQFGANPDLDPAARDDIASDPDFFNDSGSSSGTLNESSGGAFDEGNETSGLGESDGGNFDPNGDSDQDSSSGFDQGFEPGLPKAFAEGANNDLTIKAAVQIGNEATFENLLRLGNATEETVEVGIAYDRTGSGNGSNGNYGADVVDGQGPGNLSYKQAQKIYQFHASDTSDTGLSGDNANPSDVAGDLLSPNPGAVGESGNSSGVTITNGYDQPNTLATLAPGESVDIDLVVNTTNQPGNSLGANAGVDVENDILNAADITQGAFGFQTDTVQVMEVIRVVSQPVGAGS